MNETEKQELFKRTAELLRQQLLDSLLEHGLNMEDALELREALIAEVNQHFREEENGSQEKEG